VRDKVLHRAMRSRTRSTSARRDLINRLRGLSAEVRAALHPGPVPDEVLVERVRAKLGRVPAHARWDRGPRARTA